jgi:LytS/YehU family sensor histidine kinase
VNDGYHDFLLRMLDKRTSFPDGEIDQLLNRGGRGRGMHGRRGMGGGPGSHYFFRGRNPLYLAYTYNVFISLLVVGFNTTIKYATRWLKHEKDQQEREKEAVQSQLSALQSQVSPHFFMNTLNNIHALIDYDQGHAKEAVLRLSKMMRYLLYESENGKIALKKEVEFLQSYIDLMKLRLRPEVELKVQFPATVPDVEVYSLLTLSFLENAFKYGIDPRRSSFIHILFEVIDNKIHFNIRNSKGTEVHENTEKGGLGIINTRKRLELLFAGSYTLNLYDRKNEFEVDLNYPVI